jgi:predicted RNase H-like HicB family nuclease
MPWIIKQGETWTQDLRNAQAGVLQTAETRQEQMKRLQTALPLHRQAIAEIGQALASIDSAEMK